MKIKTKCEHCGKVYLMDESYAGQTAQCRSCQNNFTMTPLKEGGPSAPPPAPQPPAQAPQHPAVGQPPASAPVQQPLVQPPAQGTPSHPLTKTQTVVCPKCKFTADIPKISRKLKLTCQECGHKFLVKPESKPGRPLPTEKAPREGGSKAPALILLVLLLAAGFLMGGPLLFPELFRDLGLPNLMELLPF